MFLIFTLLFVNSLLYFIYPNDSSCEHEGCAKSFVTRNALCSHMRSHEHKLEDLKCSWEGCDKIFELPCR